jgi:hypothetical protein
MSYHKEKVLIVMAHSMNSMKSLKLYEIGERKNYCESMKLLTNLLNLNKSGVNE